MPHRYLQNASCILLTTTVLAASAHAREPGHVIIDPSDGYATTLISIPATAPAKELDGYRKNLEPRKAAKMLTWADFKGNAKREIATYIRRNDYPDVDLAAGIMQLLQQHQKTPFGLTWNGGIALTGTDYKHALRTYQSYLAAPDAKATTSGDRSRDPVHPLNHFSALIQR